MSDTMGGAADPAGLLDSILHATAAEGLGFVSAPREPPQRHGDSAAAKALEELDRRARLMQERILRDPRFVALRARWTALHRLVEGSAPGGTTVAVCHATRREIVQDLKAPALDRTLAWKAMVEDGPEAAQPAPLAALLLDAEWGAEPEETDTLQLLGGIGSVAHCPVLTHASPRLLGLDGWSAMPGEREVMRRMDGPGRARWRGFRESEEARFTALALPRIRLAEPDPARFWTDHSTGAAWLLAEALRDGFDREGWGVPPPGWQAEGLDTRDGGEAGPLAVRADAAALSGLGLVAAAPVPSSPGAAALPLRPTVQAPKRFDREAASRQAAARAQLDQVMATSRFAQALTIRGRRLVRGGAGPEAVRRALDAWLAPFREGPDAPLAEARLDLQPGRRGEPPLLVAWLAPRIAGSATPPDGVAIDIF